MKINVHIQRLVLEGLPVASLQGPEIGATIEKELARLLAQHGLSDELQGGAAVQRMKAGAFQFAGEIQPARLGQSVAAVVHEGIGGRKTEKTR
jgi:hypothetical protein